MASLKRFKYSVWYLTHNTLGLYHIHDDIGDGSTSSLIQKFLKENLSDLQRTLWQRLYTNNYKIKREQSIQRYLDHLKWLAEHRHD